MANNTSPVRKKSTTVLPFPSRYKSICETWIKVITAEPRVYLCTSIRTDIYAQKHHHAHEWSCRKQLRRVKMRRSSKINPGSRDDALAFVDEMRMSLQSGGDHKRIGSVCTGFGGSIDPRATATSSIDRALISSCAGYTEYYGSVAAGAM